MNLISIKFNVESPEVIIGYTECTKSHEYGEHPRRTTVTRKAGLELVQFAKGIGPCGRWVHKLSAEIDFATVRITQESYSADMQALHNEHEAAFEFARTVGMSPKATLRVREIQAEINKSRKVETFIYQLGDVRGRIHAVEWRGRAYRI